MRLLLDTCVLLWLFAEPGKNSRRVQSLIQDSSSEVFLSHISFIEIAIKFSKGKLNLPEPPSVLIPRLAAEHGIQSLSLSSNTIFRLESLPFHHTDPFDRLLVAHAMEAGLTLVSPDPLLRPYDTPILWD